MRLLCSKLSLTTARAWKDAIEDHVEGHHQKAVRGLYRGGSLIVSTRPLVRVSIVWWPAQTCIHALEPAVTKCATFLRHALILGVRWGCCALSLVAREAAMMFTAWRNLSRKHSPKWDDRQRLRTRPNSPWRLHKLVAVIGFRRRAALKNFRLAREAVSPHRSVC